MAHKINSFKEIYNQIVESSGSVKPKLKKSLLLLTLSAVAQGCAYVCFYPIFETLGKNINESHIYLWTGLSFLLIFISAVLRWIGQNYDYSGYSSLAQYELRTKQGNKLRQVPLELLSRKRSGQWSSIIGSNVDEVISYSMTVCSLMIYALVIPITVGLLTFLFDWKIALVILFIFPCIIPLYRWRKPAFDRGMDYLNKVHSELSAESVEYVQGLPVLKLSNNSGAKINRLFDTIEKVKSVQIIGHNKGTKSNLMIASAMEIGLLIAVGVCILFVLSGSSNAMLITALMIIIIRFAEPISNFIAMTMFFSLLEAGYQQIKKMMGIQALTYPQICKSPDYYDIIFRDVCFKYEGNKSWILENINLTIPPKSVIALVGESGSGKSTITKLVMRYADCQKGSISIGGINIQDISQSELMAAISVVFQDVYLFDDTIMNNIRMAKENATDAEIMEVAERAQCHEFISNLPLGYHTRVGDIGGNLSGGEKQRISIARALLKDTPIVILDEPTSSLDAYNELAVQRAIDELVKNKIVIIIAHRLSTIVGADKIYVLEKGRILEQGTHAELIEHAGKYYKLWDAEKYINEGLDKIHD